MANCNSTTIPDLPGKLPFFDLCEQSGKYKTRRQLTPGQIIEAAKAALANRCARGVVLTSPEAVSDYLIIHYSEKPAEVFTCVFLDNKHRLIAVEDLFFGTIDGASVYPREIVRRCLELNAAAVILCHNHPSGVIEPSQADQRITQRIKEVLALVDVRVLDHFVVGGGEAYSFASHGLL
ncbi:MAG: DNA repair protein RadC [Gammaproteobacteria bacterium]|nr:DNA repair protein RadC [Gammaproteobacteria bacterium]